MQYLKIRQAIVGMYINGCLYSEDSQVEKFPMPEEFPSRATIDPITRIELNKIRRQVAPQETLHIISSETEQNLEQRAS